MVNWFCGAALCFNNFRTKTTNGERIKFYRLPKDVSIQKEYIRVLNTKGMNFRNGHICCEHFSSGIRELCTDIPNIAAPPSQIAIMERKYENALAKITKSGKTTEADKKHLKGLKRKLSMMISLSKPYPIRKKPTNRPSYVTKSPLSLLKPTKQQLFSKLKKEADANKILSEKINNANNYITQLKKEKKRNKVKNDMLHKKYLILSVKNQI